MLELWAMVAIVVVAVGLPYFLMAVFNGPDRLDSRGRRVNRRWRT